MFNVVKWQKVIICLGFFVFCCKLHDLFKLNSFFLFDSHEKTCGAWSRKRRKWRWGDDRWSCSVIFVGLCTSFVDLKNGLTVKDVEERRWLGQYVIIPNVKRFSWTSVFHWLRNIFHPKSYTYWIWYCKPHHSFPQSPFAVGSDPKIAVGSYWRCPNSKLCSHVIAAPSHRHCHY